MIRHISRSDRRHCFPFADTIITSHHPIEEMKIKCSSLIESFAFSLSLLPMIDRTTRVSQQQRATCAEEQAEKRFHLLSFLPLFLSRLRPSTNVLACCHLLLLVARTFAFARAHTHTYISTVFLALSTRGERGRREVETDKRRMCGQDAFIRIDRTHVLVLTISDMCSMSFASEEKKTRQ